MPETPARQIYIRAAIHGASAGAAMAIFMIVFVWSTGATFGQRCEAKGFKKWSDEWDQCIQKLKLED